MSDIRDVKAIIDNVCRMALFVSHDDAVALVNEFNKMDTLMPILDPTGYRTIMGNMPGHQEAAEAFLEFRDRLEKLREKEVDSE